MKNKIIPLRFALLALPSLVYAADGTWTDTSSANTWENTAAWSGAIVADGAGFTAGFTSDITAATTVTLGSSHTIGNLLFSDNGASGSAWTLTGSTLTLSGSTPTITTTTNATIDSALSGSNGFSKTGSGTLTLTGANAGLSGTVAISAGNVYLTTANTLAGTDVNLSGSGLLYLNNATATNYSVNSLTSTRDVFINNGSTLTLASGALNFGTSSFWVQTSAGAVGYLTSGTGTLAVSTAGTSDQSIMTFIKDNSAGAVGLTKTGSGSLSLTRTNTYTGNTVVNGGTLNLAGGGGAVGTIRGTVTVNAGAVLKLSTDNATGYNTDATRVSAINLNGGTLNVNTPITTGNQTLGNTTINMTGGAITGVTNANIDFFGGTSNLNTLASSTTSTVSGTRLNMRQTGGATFTTAAGTTASGIDLDVSSAFYGNALTKAGTGTMRLTGANTQNGLIVNAGRLITGNTSALGSGNVSVASGAILQIGDGTTNTVTLASAATLALTGGSTLKLGSAASQVTATAAFTLGNGVKIDITGLNLTSGSYTLISGASGASTMGTWTATTDLLGGVNGVTYSLALNGTNLVLTAVPEPSAYGVAGVGTLIAATLIRRRARRIA